MAGKKKDEVLSTDISTLDVSISTNIIPEADIIGASLSDQVDSLSGGMSSILEGVSDVRVKKASGDYETVVNAGIAYLDVPTPQYVDEKVEQAVAPIRQELSIIQGNVQNLSIIVSGHTEQLSTLNNKINEVDLRLSDTKLDKNLSVLPDANPNLSIESKENLLVYLYNTKDNMASKAKLTELGYWDCENK